MSHLENIPRENQVERERLTALVKGLKEADFARVLPNGWTVTVALAHLAFWDLSQVVRLRRWMAGGVNPAPISSLDPEAVNGPLATLTETLAPEVVAKLVVEAAETTDKLIEELTREQVTTLLAMGLERNLRRSVHRKNHLDKIEKALKG